MPKFEVTSGDFKVIVSQKNAGKACEQAIFFHNESNHPTKLGLITSVQKLDFASNPTGDMEFIATCHLLQANSIDIGDDHGQYSVEV